MGFQEYGRWLNRPLLQTSDPDIYTDPIVFRNRVTFEGPSSQVVIVDGQIEVGGAALDHGTLAGLADDDHTQYHTDARGDARYLQLSGGELTGLLTIIKAGEALKLDGTGGTTLYQTFHREGGDRTAYIGHGVDSDAFYILTDTGDINIHAENTGFNSSDIILRADDATGTGRNRIFVDGDGITALYGRTGSAILNIDFNQAYMSAPLDMSDETLYAPKDPTDGLHVGDRDYNDARYAGSGDLGDYLPLAGGSMSGAIVSSQGTAALPAIAIGDEDTGFYRFANDVLSVALGGVASWHFYGVGTADADYFTGAGAQNAVVLNGSSTALLPGFAFRDDKNTGVHSKWADTLELVAGGVTRLTARVAGVDPAGVEITGQLYGVTDPTAGTHVGDRDYNDARYAAVGDLGDYLPLTAGSGKALTGDLFMGAGTKMSGVSDFEMEAGDDFVVRNESAGARFVIRNTSGSPGNDSDFLFYNGAFAEVLTWDNSAAKWYFGSAINLNAYEIENIDLPGAATSAARRDYADERQSSNQWLNGAGMLGDNTNFEAFTADGEYAYVGKVGFYSDTYQAGAFSPDFVPVDPTKPYYMSGWVQEPVNVGQRQYLAVEQFDVDQNSIAPYMGNPFLIEPGTETTLAVAFTPGDATITLTDGTNWDDTTTWRTVMFYPYENAQGYTYPDYEYTRHVEMDNFTRSGNVLTLADSAGFPDNPDGNPWPIGTKVQMTRSGGTFFYPWSGVPADTEWANVGGRIRASDWWHGMAFVKLGFLRNYTVAGGDVAWSGLRFEVDEGYGTYLPLAGGTMAGNINLNGNTLDNPLDPSAGTHVGDRDYNDARYLLAYGEVNVVQNATETVIASSGTAVQFLFFDTNGPSHNTTPDHTNDHLEIDVTGDYLITVSATVNSVSGAGSRFEMTVQKNNGASAVGALHCDRNIAGGGSTAGVVSMSGLATLTDGDTLEIWIENETNTANYVLEDVTLTAVQVG